MSYDRLYVQFIYYFNIKRDFYECHEVLEELWLEEGRAAIYQGLLQVAVGMHHYSYGNVSGAIKLFVAGIEKLQRYPSPQLGINLAQVIQDASDYVKKLRQAEQAPFDFYVFDIEVLDPRLAQLVDELILNPPANLE